MKGNIRRNNKYGKFSNNFVVIAIVISMNMYMVIGPVPHQIASGQSVKPHLTENLKNIADDNKSELNELIVDTATMQKPGIANNLDELEKRTENSFMVVLKFPERDVNLINSTKGAIFDGTINNLTKLIEKSGGKVVGVFKQLGILHVKFVLPESNIANSKGSFNLLQNDPTLTDINRFKQMLDANPSVASISNETIMSAYGQSLPTGVNRVDADRGPAHSGDGVNRITGGIAILDTGVQKNHPDLIVGKCISFVDNPVENIPVEDCTDNMGHGTHVAGIAAASDNGFGVVGTAPGARVFAIKVLGGNGFSPSSDIIEGLNYVAAHYYEIDVANLSLGGSGDKGVDMAVARLINTYGVITTVAAGNDHINAGWLSPAKVPEAITVSSINDFDGKCGGVGNELWDDTFNETSNYGQIVDLVAPGSRIYSTLPNSSYGLWSGTSMSAPLVAGAAALHLSLFPDASPKETEEFLKLTGTKGESTCDGNGRGYFDSLLDLDDIREPLLWMGWGACPPDCIVEPNRDSDSDGVHDLDDNCPLIANPGQKDSNGDGIGDSCDVLEPNRDSDTDGVHDLDDNCPLIANPGQKDSNGDGIGDSCDVLEPLS